MDLVPLPIKIPLQFCKRGVTGSHGGAGVAVCQDLLVISCCRELHVFALPVDIARCHVQSDLVLVRTMGLIPMDFSFSVYPYTGQMAFTDGENRLLLVADACANGFGAVHVIDAVHGNHVGYVAAPGTICFPRGVATRKSLAAVTCWERGRGQIVCVFEGSDECTWTGAVRVIDFFGHDWPYGLRFTADGLRLAVADYRNGRLTFFCAKDGSFLRHMALPPDVYPRDVEECVIEGGRAGWVTCHSGGLVAVADNDTDVTCRHYADSDFISAALAIVPGLGLVVRHSTGVQFLATPDVIAMAAMFHCKVAWMVAVRRGLLLSTKE